MTSLQAEALWGVAAQSVDCSDNLSEAPLPVHVWSEHSVSQQMASLQAEALWGVAAQSVDCSDDLSEAP
jgi:hypothetical protein